MVDYYQEQFNGGELGREMVARYDLPAYKKSCKTLINFRPMLQGGLKKRNGFSYQYNCKNDDKKCRLLKFVFSETDNFIIEMGENYFRFIDGGVQVESGGSPYEVSHTYTEAQLPLVKYRQIGDLIYIVHPDHPPRKLTRIASDNWTLEQIDFLRGPVGEENEDTAVEVYISSGTTTKGGTCTMTATSAVFDNSQIGYAYKFVNDAGTSTGYAKMTGYTSDTVAQFENQTDNTFMNGAGNAAYKWSKPSFSGNNGYPRAIAFHEQRLMLAGTNSDPLTIWGSVTGGAYETFEQGNDDDDALQFELAGQTNVIQWLVSDGLYLTAGTLGGIGFIGSGTLDASLTPTNVKANLSSTYGGSSVDSILMGENVFYISSNSKVLFELNYDDTLLRYRSFDITSQDKDILSSVSYFDKIEQPDLSLFTVDDGDLDCIIRDKINDVAGWFRYETNGDIESVATIPSIGDDEIWIAVKRGTKRFIEKLEEENSNIFLDSSVTYSGAATRTITGLAHLEGFEVSVLGDGAYSGDYTVSGGQVVLPSSSNEIENAIIGLSYNADMETMPIDIGSNFSPTLKHRRKRINRVKMLLDNTGSFRIGRSFDNLKVVPIRKTTDTMDNVSSFFGVTYPETIVESFDGNVSYEPTFCLRSNLPFPCTLHGINIQFDFKDD